MTRVMASDQWGRTDPKITLQLREPVPPVLQAGDVGLSGMGQRDRDRKESPLQGGGEGTRGGKASPPPCQGLGLVPDAGAGASDSAGRGVGDPRTPPCSEPPHSACTCSGHRRRPRFKSHEAPGKLRSLPGPALSPSDGAHKNSASVVGCSKSPPQGARGVSSLGEKGRYWVSVPFSKGGWSKLC